MATKIQTIGIEGIIGYKIEVQVKVLSGVTKMNIVGLGDQAIKEATDRVESAMNDLDYIFPKTKIVVNLSPSEIKKSGAYFDLPILIGLLVESDQVVVDQKFLSETVFLGEVGLGGELNPFRGTLPMVIEAKRKNFKRVVIPFENLEEARIISGIEIFAFTNLVKVIGWLEKKLKYKTPEIEVIRGTLKAGLDYKDVVGHKHLMKYIIAAAAGNHNILLVGPPGCGKSMISKRIPSILPPLSEEEALETMAIHSVAGLDVNNLLAKIRPFRSPHYNTSPSAVIGGGTNALPGEISLAHNGVLFLDELPEFPRRTIEALRQPMEDRYVTVARVKSTNTFPANFMLAAAMNPCKCGLYGSGKCTCRPCDILQYRQKISGPIYDRLDIQKFMNSIDVFGKTSEEEKISSGEMRGIVLTARRIQRKRFENIKGIYCNSQMESNLINEYCQFNAKSMELLRNANQSFGLSQRSKNKILTLARTFADMDESENIMEKHVTSALFGRDLEKE